MAARTRTLAELEADVLWQADREGATLRNASAQVRRAINQSIAEFREAVSESGNPYFLTKSEGSLSTGATSPYHFGTLDLSTLSPAHLRIYGFDIQVQNTWLSLEPAQFRERNDQQSTLVGGGAIPRLFFEFDRTTVAFAPASDTAYSYLLWYLPVHTDLATDGATFDGINGFGEDWVIFNAVSRLLLRDRDAHLERFELERKRLLDRVLHVGRQRQRAGAIVRGGVTNVDRWGSGRGLPFPGAGDGLNGPGSGEGGRIALGRTDGRINWYAADENGSDLKWNGSTWVKKRGWIVVDPGSNYAEVTAALNTRDGVCVELAEGTHTWTAPVSMPRAGSALVGRGNETRVDLVGAADQNWITSSANGVRVSKLYFHRTTMPTATPSGYVVKLTLGFGSRVDRLFLEQCENGIWLEHCTDTIVRDIKPRNCFGNRGVYLGSATAWGNQNYVYDLRCEAGGYAGGYPAAFSASMAAAWSASEVVSSGAIRIVGGVLIWQCTTGGTCAGTNTTLITLPSTDPNLARSTAVANGTAQFKYIGRADHYALTNDSRGGDLFAENIVGLNGGGAYLQIDSLAPGNAPHIVRIKRLVADHVLDYGALINAGSDVELQGEVLTLREAGIAIGSGVYDWHLRNCKALGCAKEGIFANSGNGSITDCRIGHNSQKTNNTYDGMVVAGDHNVVVGNRSGNIWDGGTACPQRYGLNYASGAHYAIVGNWFLGNTTGTLVHPSGTGAQVANNVVA